ncbi:hypothetical protein D3C71_1676650 [compost metagenome]
MKRKLLILLCFCHKEMGTVISWQSIIISTNHIPHWPVWLKGKCRNAIDLADKAVHLITWQDGPVKCFEVPDWSVHFPERNGMLPVKPFMNQLNITVDIKRTKANAEVLFFKIPGVYYFFT